MKIKAYAILMVLLIVSGCNSYSKVNPPDQDLMEDLYQEPTKSEEYQFQIGDVFDVKFLGFPAYDQSIVVRPDGRISLPLVDNLQVIGMTPTELDQIITDNYKKKIKDPEVSIVLKEFAGQRIFIGGEINNPGEKLLMGKMTLTQSIFQAGGFTRTAELKSVGLIRKKNADSLEIYLINVDKIIYQGESDVLLKPYDMIFVPKTFIAKVGDFVDLYINALIPNATRFTFIYRLNTTDTPF